MLRSTAKLLIAPVTTTYYIIAAIIFIHALNSCAETWPAFATWT